MTSVKMDRKTLERALVIYIADMHSASIIRNMA